MVYLSLLFFGTKSPLSRRGQRAKNFAVPPLVRCSLTKTASCRIPIRPRNNGRTRNTPTGPWAFGVSARRCIQPCPSPLFTVQGLSAQLSKLTIPLHRISLVSLTDFHCDVKKKALARGLFSYLNQWMTEFVCFAEQFCCTGQHGIGDYLSALKSGQFAAAAFIVQCTDMRESTPILFPFFH